MKANELMIGDWVQRNGKNFQVTSIMDGYISTREHSDSHDYHFNPIPLTAEILEKNGWVKNGRYNDYIIRDENDCFIGYNTDTRHVKISVADYRKYYEIYSFIECVHELQHALRLCGLNELADNFKV